MTLHEIARKNSAGEKLVAVTAYDVLFARLADSAGVDIVLVGDSVGNVVAGFDSTLPVTLAQMVYHGAAVRRGVQRAFLTVDMPFLSYQASVARAILNCGRVMRRTGADAVKLEGGHPRVAQTICALTTSGIPVMGHIGFTPQSVRAFGGARVQGRAADGAERLLGEAAAVQDAGAFALVLELVPADLARRITESVNIPTIGIGAGPHCSGQVLVLPDLLGLNDDFAPKFLKRYADLASVVRSAVGEYAREVRDGSYPGAEHSL